MLACKEETVYVQSSVLEPCKSIGANIDGACGMDWLLLAGYLLHVLPFFFADLNLLFTFFLIELTSKSFAMQLSNFILVS